MQAQRSLQAVLVIGELRRAEPARRLRHDDELTDRRGEAIDQKTLFHGATT